MRKIYLICIVFWRQTDGKIHDELIIVSLFPSTLDSSISSFSSPQRTAKKRKFYEWEKFSANVSAQDRDLSLHPLDSLRNCL
jgi:hypothetical protein